MENKDVDLSTALGQLISILRDAETIGFLLKKESSPVELLLEALIDLILIVRRELTEGKKETLRNPELRFLDRSDELGNPKQIKVSMTPSFFWDPLAPKILWSLASMFVRLRNGSNLRAAFMAEFGVDPTTGAPKAPVVSSTTTTRRRRFTRENFWYFHRRRLKLNPK